MKHTTLPRRIFPIPVFALAFLMSGCLENKEQTAEIKRLKEATEELEYDVKDLREVKTTLQKKNDEVRQKLADAERKIHLAERELNTAKRELERYQEKERRAAEEKQREPTRSEKIAQAKKTAEEQLSALITVTGDRTSGTGILVGDGGKTWLYVPARVLAGNLKLEITTHDGETLKKFGAFEMAAGDDLARLEVLEAPEAKLTLPAKPVDFSQGSSLYGVNDSSQIVSGRAYGTKAESIEVDSSISGCSPGSPVFYGESGVILGIVTDPLDSKRDLWRQGDDFGRRPNRIVTRLDRAIQWTAMPIGAFLKESKMIEQADRFTRLVNAFVAIAPSPAGMNLNAAVGGGTSARDILDANKSLSVVRSIYELGEWLDDDKTKKLSPRDVNRRVISVLDQMANESRKQSTAFKAMNFSPFHRAAAKQSLEWRQEAMHQLDNLITSVKEGE